MFLDLFYTCCTLEIFRNNGVTTATFPDDTALLTAGNNVETVTNNLQIIMSLDGQDNGVLN